ETLRTVRQHLRKDGLFIFDVWYGPAVLNERPSQRIKVINSDQRTLLRAASGDLDTYEQTTTVNYHVWEFQEKQLLGETEESHTMRYFFAKELELFLSDANLSVLEISEFPYLKHKPTDSSWNVIVVARAN